MFAEIFTELKEVGETESDIETRKENARLRSLIEQYQAFERLVISLHPAFKEYEVTPQ